MIWNDPCLRRLRRWFFVGVNEGNIPKSTQTGGILSELDRDFFQEQGVELAPGPKELMNMQRFYLYLNMTKPGEKLILSYSDTNAKGEGSKSGISDREYTQSCNPKAVN